MIADVGQDVWEEVEYAPQADGGRPGGQLRLELPRGPRPLLRLRRLRSPSRLSPTRTPLTPATPITGGYVVRDSGLPSLLGRYLYGDFCQETIRSLRLGLPAASDDRAEPIEVPGVTSFGQDACGRLYVATFGGGVYRIVGETATDCRGPQLSLRGKLRQRLGARGWVTIGAHSDEASTVTVVGRVWVAGARRAAVDLLPSTLPSAGGSWHTLSWKLGRRAASATAACWSGAAASSSASTQPPPTPRATPALALSAWSACLAPRKRAKG